MNKDLEEKIRIENIKISRAEAPFYDVIHGEIFNRYEQARINRDIDLIALFGKGTPRVALDIGCGTGNLFFKFLKRGFHVVGVDISREMIDILRDKLGNRANLMDLHCSEIDNFLKDEKREYDVVSISSVLHHLPNWYKTLETICDRISNKGILYITHEPTFDFRTHFNPIHKFLNYVEYGLTLLYIGIKLYGKKLPILDYSYSDYHVKKGIDQHKIKNLLFRKGFKILLYEEYYCGKNMWFAIINNLLRCSRAQFSLIAFRAHNFKNKEI